MTKKAARSWAREHARDFYVRQARKHGYRSRAACKLLEMHRRFGLLKRGSCILDLGAAPGGWSQAASETAGGDTCIFALDRLPMEPLDRVTFIQGDFTSREVTESLLSQLGGRRVDLVLSDLAPNLGGNRVADMAQMSHLHELILDFSERILDKQGTLLMKAFAGDGLQRIQDLMKKGFSEVKSVKPDASRPRSRELYLMGRNRTQRRMAS